MAKLITKLTLVGEVNTNSLKIWWDIYDYILNGNVDIQDVEVNESLKLLEE